MLCIKPPVLDRAQDYHLAYACANDLQASTAKFRTFRFRFPKPAIAGNVCSVSRRSLPATVQDASDQLNSD
jgi:hypothetical protein